MRSALSVLLFIVVLAGLSLSKEATETWFCATQDAVSGPQILKFRVSDHVLVDLTFEDLAKAFSGLAGKPLFEPDKLMLLVNNKTAIVAARGYAEDRNSVSSAGSKTVMILRGSGNMSMTNFDIALPGAFTNKVVHGVCRTDQ